MLTDQRAAAILLLSLSACDGSSATLPPGTPIGPDLTFTCEDEESHEPDGFSCAAYPAYWACALPKKPHPRLVLLPCHSAERVPLQAFHLAPQDLNKNGDVRPLFHWPITWPEDHQPSVLLAPASEPVTASTLVTPYLYLPVYVLGTAAAAEEGSEGP